MTPDFGEAKPSAIDSRVRAAHAKASMIVLAFAASIVLFIAIGIFNISSQFIRRGRDQFAVLVLRRRNFSGARINRIQASADASPEARSRCSFARR